MTTTRHRILEMIRKQGPSSAEDLALVLRLTPADVRRHLGILAGEGLVELSGVRLTGRKGRPAQLFQPAGSLLGDNLAALADQALDCLLGPLSAEETERVLRNLALRLAGPPGAPGIPGPRRLGETVARLNQMRYQARWEARPEGPRVFFGRCPYRAILDRHPELCRMDACMLENRLGQPVEQVDRLARSAQGAVFCSFQMRAK